MSTEVASSDKNIVTLVWGVYNYSIHRNEIESPYFNIPSFKANSWYLKVKKTDKKQEISCSLHCKCKVDDPVRVNFQFILLTSKESYSKLYTVDFEHNTTSQTHKFEDVGLSRIKDSVTLKCMLWEENNDDNKTCNASRFEKALEDDSLSKSEYIDLVNYIRGITQIEHKLLQFTLPLKNFFAFKKVHLANLIVDPANSRILWDIVLKVLQNGDIMLEVASSEMENDNRSDEEEEDEEEYEKEEECVKFILLDLFVVDIHNRRHKFLEKYELPSLSDRYIINSNINKKKVLSDKKLFLVNDALHIQFEIIFGWDVLYSIVEASFKPPPKTSGVSRENVACLSEWYSDMYRSGKLSDVTLRTLDRDFAAHKAILSSRSSVFEAMFTTEMKERDGNTVDIPDVESSIIDRMLQFMYSQTMNELDIESARKLYAASDKYAFIMLRDKCKTFLKENLSPLGSFECLLLADNYSDEDLKKFTLNFISENHFEVLSSTKWKQLIAEHPAVAGEVMTCVSSILCKSSISGFR